MMRHTSRREMFPRRLSSSHLVSKSTDSQRDSLADILLNEGGLDVTREEKIYMRKLAFWSKKQLEAEVRE